MRIALATCADLPDGFEDDHPAAKLLDADYRVWSDPGVDWTAYDRVVIRSTWDYARRRDEFVAWAAGVGARLRNSPDLVAWNSDKRYLATLGDVPTVATVFVAPGEEQPDLAGEVVVKPTVSAGGRDTGRFGPRHHEAARALIADINAGGRTAMVQPYLATVDTAGETAVVLIGGEVSHVLHKKAVLRPDEVAPMADLDWDFAPAAAMLDDDLVSAGSADDAQLALARRVGDLLADRFGAPLYVRVDMVVDEHGAPVVMEIEAIEPCLYLATAPGAAERLAAAVLAG